MKRRLLSLLLVMAMLLSMVPFQAFAEEVDEAPALLEETEELVSEIPEDTVPETAEETVPETTEEIIPETTEETVPVVLEEVTPDLIEEDPVGASEDTITVVQPENCEMEVLMDGRRYELVAKIGDGADNEGIEWRSEIDYLPVEKDPETNKWYLSFSAEHADNEVKDGDECIITVNDVREDVTEKAQPVEVTVTLRKDLPMMIIVGMDGDYDGKGSMPQKAIRADQTFTLQAKLTKDSDVNKGIEWFLDANEQYGDCQPINVETNGKVTFNKNFDFARQTSGGAWVMAVARQVVAEGEKKTVADSPVVISVFPELSLSMYIGDESYGETAIINAVDGFKPVSITAFPNDFGPFGGVTLTLNDSDKILKSAKKTTQHMDGPDCDSEVYTVTPKKTGTFTITATSKDNPEVTLTTTVTVVNETREINIKVPSSARTVTETDGKFMMKAVIMAAGQKLSLSTDIPKTAADKAVTWEIIDSHDVEPKPVSDTMAPEGATVSGQDWDAVVSIDEKGVLRTNAGVTMETVQVGVRVCLTSTAEDENPVEDTLLVLIQPPVETMFVYPIPLRRINSITGNSLESMDGGTNIKITDDMFGDFDIGNGPMLFIPVGMTQSGEGLPFLFPDISWKFSGSKKVVEFMTLDEFFGDSEMTDAEARIFEILRAMDARVMVPKAPGKVSITATTRDGSGAKCSYSFNLVGMNFDSAVINPPKDFVSSKALHPGDQVQFTSEAYYYEGAPATGVQREWQVYCADDRNADDFATIDQKGKLTITDRVSKPAQLTIYCVLYNKEGSFEQAQYSVYVEPVNDYTLGLHSQSGGLLNTVNSYTYEPGEVMTLQPFWVDKSGQVDKPVAAEDVRYKVSGSACAFDQATGKLTFKKPGTTKITVTATLDGEKQSATYTFRCEYFTRKIEIQKKPADGVITVVGGKSLSLKAINWSSETTKATDQSIYWDLDSYRYADINEKTGKLTTDKVSQATEVMVCAYCNGLLTGNYVADTVTIRIIPEKTQYRSYAYMKNVAYGDGNYLYLTGAEQILNGYDVFSFDAYSYGLHIPTQITKLTSSNPKIVEIVNNADGEPINIRIPENAKPGKVTITINGKMTVGKDGENNSIYQDAPSVKVTINVVQPVTSIEIKRPTDKDDNDLPLYVGKSLKLSATVNKDATNKKLVWHIDDRQPSGDDYFTIVNGLSYLDKTTIKNGVLKVDKSSITASRYYYVWATSEDGFAHSKAIPIQAYAMTGAINIDCYGDWPDGKYEDYLNNRTVTIKPGEELKFRALVSDVNGYDEGANPDITWTISGKKDIVKKLYEYMDEDVDADVLGLKGLNPGTVTIKAAAKDGSKKTATFKLVVQNDLSAPDGVPETVSGGSMIDLPRLAYNYKPGTPSDEIIWMNADDISWSCSDASIVPYHQAEAGSDLWFFDVPEGMESDTELTFTATDVRTGIPEAQRAAPFSFTTTYIKYGYTG